LHLPRLQNDVVAVVELKVQSCVAVSGVPFIPGVMGTFFMFFVCGWMGRGICYYNENIICVIV